MDYKTIAKSPGQPFSRGLTTIEVLVTLFLLSLWISYSYRALSQFQLEQEAIEERFTTLLSVQSAP